MIKVIMAVILMSSIFSQTKIIQKDKWVLLGAVDDINLETSLTGSCSIYLYNNKKWFIYNSQKKDFTTVQKGIGFWATSSSTCNLDTKQKINKIRFVNKTINNQTILIDNTNNIEWVNSAPGCNPTHIALQTEAYDTSKKYCENLSFASYSDWRLPSISEAKTFIVDTEKAGIVPYYQNIGCPRLIGFNADKTKVQTATTHNLQPSGIIKDWEGLNAGIRCVRNDN